MNTSISDKVALFVECFGDSADEAEKFFSCRDVTIICKYEEDGLAAMAGLVPILAEENVSGYYLYGVCVAKAFRGRGFFRTIMQMAEEEAIAHGAQFVCLIPADRDLAQTYRRFSYDVEVLPKGSLSGKGIELLSEDFRAFARCEEELSGERMYGLLKSFDNERFCPCDGEFVFCDDMGDV